MKYSSLEEFITRQEELVDLEHVTEVEEQKHLYESKSVKHLENKGICLRNMFIEHHKTGMYGRFMVTFSSNRNKEDKGSGGDESQSHKFTSGDIVGAYPNKGEDAVEISNGVVSYSRGTSITIAFHEDFDVSLFPLYRLMLLTNEVTYRRLKRALNQLKRVSSEAPCVGLIDQLFPCQPVEESLHNDVHKEIDYFSETLDSSQKNAVKFVLQSKQKVSVIHGPPGTGKTTTVVEVVRQAVKHCSQKVLVCAPSNIAVDNLVEKLAGTGLKVVRLGHPARVSVDLQKYSLDAMLTNRDSSDIIKSVRKDISSFIGRFKKCRNKSEIFALRKEVKELRKELVTRESKAMKEVLTSADVILATANSASSDGPLKHLPAKYFDMLIIDEAAQALEISCWIPVLQSPRLILVGDHKQLPPTIISHEAARKGLAVTLLERVVHGLGDNVVSMLTTQYRMHESIMRWPSKELYDSKLVAAESVAKHLLCDLDGVEKNADTCTPLVFVDTAGFNMLESEVEEDESKGNEWEVEIVKDHVDVLVQAGLQPRKIGIITPYNLQVKLLRKSILAVHPHVEIHSVDGFQGREKEAILISMVRSNDKGNIGFLAEDRRMNVALTRARRHLFVVGDSQTVSHHPFLKSMCKYLQTEGDLRSPDNAVSFGGVISDPTTASMEKFELPDSFKSGSYDKQNKKSTVSEKFARDDSGSMYQKNDGAETVTEKTTPSDKLQHHQPSVQSGSNKSLSKPVPKVVIRDKIEDFSKNTESELVFPSTLSAKERAFVHEVSEQCGLHHISCGDGNERRIVVSKMDSKPKSEGTVLKTDPPKKIKKEEGHLVCEICSVNVPSANYDLHLLRCQRVKKAEEICSKDKEEKNKNAKKKKANKKKNTQKEPEEEEEDIDAIIDSYAKLNSKCNFPKCKNPVKVLGQKCKFCSMMFCLSHHMAEIHGCGDAAKIKARQDISKFKGHFPKPMNDVKKAQVQNKLDTKISKLEEQRKKKAKES